jgi:hypothetical protein
MYNQGQILALLLTDCKLLTLSLPQFLHLQNAVTTPSFWVKHIWQNTEGIQKCYLYWLCLSLEH